VTALEIRRRFRLAFLAYEKKLVARCSASLRVVFADGDEEVVGPPTSVEFNPPMSVCYVWRGNFQFTKEVVALRLAGTGSPMSIQPYERVTNITWTSGIQGLT